MAFYLSDIHTLPGGGFYPASGLYHYKETVDGDYEWGIIDAEGDVQSFEEEVSIVLIDDGSGDSSEWIKVPNTNPAEYISFLPYKAGGVIHTYSSPCSEVGADYILPEMVYQNLYLALELRYALGYEFMRNWAENNPPPVLPPTLDDNLTVFWESIDKVATRGIDRCENSLIPPEIVDQEFRNPAWSFQLIRIIAEGFIDGHAKHLYDRFNQPESGKYRVKSQEAWRRVLRAIENDVTWGEVRDIPEAFGLLPSDRETILEMVFFGDSIPTFLQQWYLNLITPGITSQQEIAFWLVHVPHWYGDLCQAVSEFDRREPEAAAAADKPNKHDWDMFEEVIMGGFPTGEGTSAWDRLLERLALWGLSTAEDSEFNPRNFLIGRIFEKVRARSVGGGC